MKGMYSRCIFNRPLRAVSYTLVVLVGVVTGDGYADSGAAGEIRPSPCRIVDEAAREASRLRGITLKKPVPCVMRSRAEVELYLQKTIAEKFPVNTLEMEQLVYRAIGVIPDDYDYVQGIVAAYVGQLGGYYDPDEKEFIIVDSISDDLGLPIAVHELTHALQDQEFNLSSFLDPKLGNSDLLLARAALVEGDATAIMQDFLQKESNSSNHGGMQKLFAQMKQRANNGTIPNTLQKILVFPYVEGLTFVRKILRESGSVGLQKAFANAPQNSRQILHPEEFRFSASIVTIPPTQNLERIENEDTMVYSDTIGEFVAGAVLTEALTSPSQGAACARGLAGDRVGVFKTASGAMYVSWRTEWDSERDAREFAECYKAMVSSRYKRALSTDFVDLSEHKRARLSQAGRVVSIVIEAR